ncbi:Alpha/beta hydrolase domain-containing protein 17A, partial [Trichinella papuae]
LFNNLTLKFIFNNIHCANQQHYNQCSTLACAISMDKVRKAEENLSENPTTSCNANESREVEKMKRSKRKFKFASFLTNTFNAIKTFRLPIPSCLLNCIAFAPPQSSQYEFVKKSGETTPMNYFVTILPSIVANIPVAKVKRMLFQSNGFYLESTSSTRIACVHMKNSIRQPSPMFIIMSHLNACDMAAGMEYGDLLCRYLGLDVYMYDYPGYGLSKGRPSENGLYRSHDLLYKYMTTELKIPPKKIILIGISIGTVPAIDLASKEEVGCLIVMSSFTSAYGTICPNAKWNCFKDRLCNLSKIREVNSPTLIIHGEEDEMFDVRHSMQLAENCPYSCSPVVIAGASHSAVPFKKQTMKKISEFLYANFRLLRPPYQISDIDERYETPEFFVQLYAKLNDAKFNKNEKRPFLPMFSSASVSSISDDLGEDE